MSGIARVPRADKSWTGFVLVTSLLVMAGLSSCSGNLFASTKGCTEPAADTAKLFDAEDSSNLESLIPHSTRISPPAHWDGSIDGMKTLWFDSGAKSGEGRFVKGSKEGPWTYWYENGQKRWEGTYHTDLVEGVERSWYQNGTLCNEGISVGGRRHGAFRAWYEDGQHWWRGEYQLGVRQGPFRYWHRDGSVDDKVSGVYVNGKRVKGLGADGLALASK